MPKTLLSCVLSLLAIIYAPLTGLWPVLGADPAPTAAAAPAAEPITVTPGPFRVNVELDGILTAERTSEVVVRPESWSELIVLEAVSHGAVVKQGTPLLKLETKKLDEAIADLEADVESSALALRLAIEDVRLLERTGPLDLAAAERAAQYAAEDLKRFNERDRPLALRAAEAGLRMSTQYHEYQQEELRQLEKMYKADDITEETEEIVLKRARNDMENSKFSLEQAKASHEQATKVTIPRREIEAQRAAQSTALDLEKARATTPITLNQKQLALAKLKQDQTKSVDKLAKLRGDRARLTVSAPIDGIVYFGRATDGKWSGISEAADMLRTGGRPLAGSVLMTVVSPERLYVRTVVPEKHFGDLRPGQTGKVALTAFAGAQIPAKLRSIDAIPSGAGFDAEFELTATAKVPLAAGMTGKITVVAREESKAIAVPADAVQTDENDDSKSFVLVVGSDGKPTRRDVTVGRRIEDRVEITGGLTAGEKILPKKPA
ncbi:MAG: efflux RND transporter periplasmic adaptor subunit [Pirellulales bacterium]